MDVRFKATSGDPAHTGVRDVRIGELARRTGASVRALRYYEEQDLLLAHRTSGGHRSYDEAAVHRVQLIQLLIAAGVPSGSIVGILPCLRSGTITPGMLDELREQRRRIEERARTALETLDRLDGVIRDAVVRLEPAAR